MATIGATAGMTQASVRSTNLALVLGCILRESGAISRADIAAQLGMTRSTVSRLVDDLVLGELVEEGVAVGGARGRPAVPLAARGHTVLALGLEINVERIVATVVDLAGNILAVRNHDVDVIELGVESAMEDLQRLAGEALADCPAEARVVSAVLALPGLVDRDGRLVLRSPNLGWEGADPVAHWSLRVRGEEVQLRAANDIDCSALTVLRDYPGTSFLYVTGEVGIGSAISMNGQLLTGRHGWASELGHVCVDPRGAMCGCGAVGCLETVVGAHVLLQNAGQPSVDALIAALEAEDPRACAAIAEAAEALGIAVGAALNLLDVTTVNLGGHLGLLEPWLNDPLQRELAARVLWSQHSAIEIAAVSHAPLRAAVGAGLAALSSVVQDPAAWVDPVLNR